MKNQTNNDTNQGSGIQIRTMKSPGDTSDQQRQQQQVLQRRISSSGLNGDTNEHDDDDILDLAEQTNRPVDDSIHQQRVQAWHPILDPLWVIIGLFYLGIIFVPTSTYEKKFFETMYIVALLLLCSGWMFHYFFTFYFVDTRRPEAY